MTAAEDAHLLCSILQLTLSYKPLDVSRKEIGLCTEVDHVETDSESCESKIAEQRVVVVIESFTLHYIIAIKIY